MLILANVAIHDDDYVQENYDGEHIDDGDDVADCLAMSFVFVY